MRVLGKKKLDNVANIRLHFFMLLLLSTFVFTGVLKLIKDQGNHSRSDGLDGIKVKLYYLATS